MVIYNVQNIQCKLDSTCTDHTMWLDLVRNESKIVKKGGKYLDSEPN